MSHNSLREESRRDYTSGGITSLTLEKLSIGALLRIADASEAMAKNHRALLDDNTRLNVKVKLLRQQVVDEQRSNAALRGYITKLKHKLEAI
jgi:hypothetical protein